MRLKRILLAGAAGAALSGLGWSAPAMAQSEGVEDSGPRVVTVTAQRRAESLQDVPVAVTAVTAEDIENRQIGDIIDLQYTVPNISIATGTGTANSARIFLRGVGEDESRGAVDPAVGVYVDGVYIGRQVGSLFDVVDLAQIEVLRGPQGTLYGRNTNGGAIKLTSVRPQMGEHSGELRATIGNHGRTDVRGTYNVPITDDTAFRVTGLLRERDGFHDLQPNGALAGQGREVGELHTIAWRASLEKEFNADWNAFFAVDYTVDHSDPVPDSAAPPNDADNDVFTIEPVGATVCSSATPATVQPLGCFTGYDNALTTMGLTANITGRFGTYDFNSVSAYREMDDELATRIGFPYFQETQQNQYSQEFTLASNNPGAFDWVGGVYLFSEDVLLDTTFIFPFSVSVKTEAWAVFAQGEYDLSDRSTLTGGLRYTSETKDFDGANLAFNLTRSEAQNFENLSYTLGFDHRFNDQIMAYAKYATGFKSGGWSPDCFGGAACFLPVEEETLDSIEAGVRTDLFGDTLRLNGTVFFNQYENLQIGATVPGLGFTRFNVDETEIQGLELEFQFYPAERVEIFGNAGLLEAEYTSLTPSQAGGLTNSGSSPGCTSPTDINCALGLDLKNAPGYKGLVGAAYTVPFAAGDLRLSGDVSFEDESWSLVANSPPHALTDPGVLYNARVAWSNDRYSLALWGQNLSDEEYWRAASATSFTVYAAPPLTWGVDLGVKF